MDDERNASLISANGDIIINKRSGAFWWEERESRTMGNALNDYVIVQITSGDGVEDRKLLVSNYFLHNMRQRAIRDETREDIQDMIDAGVLIVGISTLTGAPAL